MTNRFMTSHAAGAPAERKRMDTDAKEQGLGRMEEAVASEWRLADTEKKKSLLSSSSGHGWQAGHPNRKKYRKQEKIKRTQGELYTYVYTKIIKKNVFH